MMARAATIIIARDDLSIACGPDSPSVRNRFGTDIEHAFFDLVRSSQPDVIVLDCRGDATRGITAIHKVRQRTDTPVLVICSAGDRRLHEYRIAGAADCLAGPFDILHLNQAIQQIMQVNAPALPRRCMQSGSYEVAGLLFDPLQNNLSSREMNVKLTTAENRLLLHFLARPFTVCSRTDIAEALYGARPAQSDRAIDVIVTRLRKKFVDLRGPNAPNVIRTEFRQGYTFVGEVKAAAPEAPETRAPAWAAALP
jgi:DNA-binding response OmpR family regulator